MNELPCLVCGPRPADEFRLLDRSLHHDGPAVARVWHVLGCRRLSHLESSADGFVTLVEAQAGPGVRSPEVIWLTRPTEAHATSGASRAAGAPAVLASRRDTGPSDTAGPTRTADRTTGTDEPLGAPGPPARIVGSEGGADVLVALPDEPPVPFERPVWPAGPEAASARADGPRSATAPSTVPPVRDEHDPNDRFRERRPAAQPVERVVRRPVGLVGPGQPRSVDLTRRPPVDAPPQPRRGPAFGPRLPLPATSSLFARSTTRREAGALETGAPQAGAEEGGAVAGAAPRAVDAPEAVGEVQDVAEAGPGGPTAGAPEVAGVREVSRR